MQKISSNEEKLSSLGKKVLQEVYLLWIRRLVFRRIIPLALILVVAASFLAQLVFWSHVIENMHAVGSVEGFTYFLVSAFLKTGSAVQLLLVSGPIITVLFLRNLVAIAKRILR